MKIDCPQKTVSVREIRSHSQGATRLCNRFFVRKAVGWAPKQTSPHDVSRGKIGIELQGFSYCLLGFEPPLLIGSIEKIALFLIGAAKVRPGFGKGIIT